MLAALKEDTYTPETNERDLLEVLSIFAQRIALIIENHNIYSQLLDSKRKMEAVVLSISDGVIVTDSDLNILIHNSLAGRLVGSHTTTGVQSLHLPWLIHNEDLIDLLQRCIAESLSDSMDVDLRLGRDLAYLPGYGASNRHARYGRPRRGSDPARRDSGASHRARQVRFPFHCLARAKNSAQLGHGFPGHILMGKTGPITESKTTSWDRPSAKRSCCRD